jgi:hypothetical protein
LERRLLQPNSADFWRGSSAMTLASLNDALGNRISGGIPCCVARIGEIEARIALWGMHIPRDAGRGLSLPLFYSDTAAGATHAGIRPRSPALYRRFAELFCRSIPAIDYLGVWKTANEYALLRNLPKLPGFFEGEFLSPTMQHTPHWVESLDGRRVLVLSPFQTSIERQLERIDRVWENRGWKWRAEFRVVRFPFLIDEDCPESWTDVWDEMLAIVQETSYDVALLGCGGLGMPLAAAAKSAGRIGIQMGGLLQLLFGIYGRRHLKQDWHSRWINDSWVRPTPGETPKTAWRVEDGCYW